MHTQRTRMPRARAGQACVFEALLLVLFTASLAHAAIPWAARNDARYKLGYLVVTHYSGVRTDGTGDSTAGIQQAIEDAYENDLTVFFPAGTYQITDTLKCYRWHLWVASKDKASIPPRDNHILLGSAQGAERPLIRLAPSAPLFDDEGKPRPMLCYREFSATVPTSTEPVEPSDPLGLPPGFADSTACLFGCELRGLDFDCNGHDGAFGVYFPAAQSSSIEDVRVEATGAYAGLVGLPGRNGGAFNVEVIGGRYGIRSEGSMAGTVIAGATLIGQTERAIHHADFVPLAVVGFRIVKSAGPVITTQSRGWSDAPGCMSLIDGTIEVGSGLVLDNDEGKSVYIRNVSVSGTDSLIRSKNRATVTGSGAWKRIVEYSHTDQTTPSGDPPYETDDSFFRVFSVLNGSVSRTPEPAVTIEDNADAPPADLLSRHIWTQLPLYEGQADGTLVVTDAPYRATPDDETDDRAAIQAAIDDASAAGHGRVFLPAGVYRIGNTLTLRSNTVLTGAGKRKTRISWHESWQPTTGEPSMVRTDDDPAATTFLGFLEINVRGRDGGVQSDGAYRYDRYNHVHWRAGRNSMIVSIEFDQDWVGSDVPTNPRNVIKFTGGAGGRHYTIEPNVHAGHLEFRGVLIDGTTEPLSFYGLNVEHTKQAPIRCATNIEIRDAANIRIYSVKREGNSPTLIVQDSRNVAMFSSGAMRGAIKSGLGGYVQVYGTSDQVLMANLITQTVNEGDPNGEPMLREDLAGSPRVEVTWPECVSLYKRGALDDDAMLADGPNATFRVATGADDAEERLDTGAVSLSSSDLELVRDDNGAVAQLVGIRFANMSIPAGSTIEQAWLEFATDETSSEPTALTIRAQATDDAAPFSSSTGNLSARPRTTASVAWAPDAWDTLGERHSSPDLAAVVRAIIDRPGWQAGNALALLIDGAGKRVAVSCDKSAAAAPKLCLVYTAPRPPNTPFGLTAAPLSSTRVRVSWVDNSEDETGFRVQRRQSMTDTWLTAGTVAADTTTFDDAGLAEGTKYYYKVAAYNAVGSSPESAIAAVTTPIYPPAAPDQLKVLAVSSTDIQLAWQDRSGNETSFKIDRRRSGTTSWERIATLAPDTTGYSDTAVLAATKFYYKVKAWNSAGNSAYTPLVWARTPDGIVPAASWRYRKGTAEASDPPAAWRRPGFDDSGWAQGAAPFGYGDGPYGTELADMQGNYSCLFLRQTFQVANPAAVAELSLHVLYDDGFVLWLNGQELARHNMGGEPGQFLPYSATASASVADGTEWTATLNGGTLPVLHEGENVLALQVFNSSLSGSSDFTADAELSLVISHWSLAADADQDALPDLWEAAHLSDLSDGSELSDADPDNDGLSNLEEYVAGTSPRDDAGCWMLDAGLNGGQLQVSFDTVLAEGPGYDGLTRHYALEQRPLTGDGHWAPVPGYEDTLATGTPVTYAPAADAEPCAFRARVWLVAGP